MPSVKQDNFSGGEIAPSLHANTKLTKRRNGLGLCRNFYIDRHGIPVSRGGTEYIAESADSDYDYTRVIPFILNNDTTYQIEIGDESIRVLSGSTVKDTVDAPWTGSSVAELQYQQSGNIITVVAGDNSYPPYEIERVSDTSWTVTKKSNTPAIKPPVNLQASLGGAGSETYYYGVTAVDANGNESLIGAGAGAALYGISHPSSTVGVDYSVRALSVAVHGMSTGDKCWIDGSTYASEANGHEFIVEALTTTEIGLDGVDGDSFSKGPAIEVSNISKTNPAVVNATAHGLTTGNQVYMFGNPMVEVNDRIFTVTVPNANQFSLDGEDATGHTVGGAGYCNLIENSTLKFYLSQLEKTSAAVPTSSAPHSLSWTAPTSGTAVEYNIYKKDTAGTWGLIGVSTELAFDDTGIDPDTSIRPPVDGLHFFDGDDWPAAIGHYQQRMFMGNTTADVEQLRGSRVAGVDDFNLRIPAEDDDPVDYRMTGRQVNAIKHILDIGRMVVLTQGGVKLVQGDANGTITPSTPNIKQVSYRGASSTRPLVVGSKALFVENDGRTIRDLAYEFESDGYVGVDLTTFASHLLDGNRVIVDWAYQQSPNSIIWIIVDDKDWKTNRTTSDAKTSNMLIGLTYIPEQDIWAFHRHDSAGGEFESICATPGTNADDITLVVKRTINSATKRYIEKLNNRVITDVEVDAICLDSHLTYDGRNTGATTLTLTTGTDYDAGESLTCTSSVAYFSSGKVGNKLHLRSVSSAFNAETGRVEDTVSEVVCYINAYTSTTVVTVIPETDVPTALQNTATTNWGEAVDAVSGLSHLEGESVRACGDGNPIPARTVSSGAISMPDGEWYEVIHVGYGYNCDLETLPLDNTEGEALSNKKIRINEATLEVSGSRGFKAGRSASDLKELKRAGTAQYTGKRSITIPCTWADNGKIFIRQEDPLPLTITGITLQGIIEEGE